jgi:hypothetical protein
MRGLLVALLLFLPQVASAQVRERLYPDESVRELWNRVVACAGSERDTTKTLEQVVFLVRDSTYFQDQLLKGEWAAPDTVYLTVGLENEGWVVAHELMHHALNGPPGPPSAKHPIELFTRCRLFEYQQKAGGMMGGARLDSLPPEPKRAAGTTLMGQWTERYYVRDPLTVNIYR